MHLEVAGNKSGELQLIMKRLINSGAGRTILHQRRDKIRLLAPQIQGQTMGKPMPTTMMTKMTYFSP
jgi:hypothetical protein